MPLGPRPEPPKLPRKEPNTVDYYQHLPLAFQSPTVPPKTPLNEPYVGYRHAPQQQSPVSPESPYKNGKHRTLPSSDSMSSLSSVSSLTSVSSSSSRLKGPRPISASALPRKPVNPYGSQPQTYQSQSYSSQPNFQQSSSSQTIPAKPPQSQPQSQSAQYIPPIINTTRLPYPIAEDMPQIPSPDTPLTPKIGMPEPEYSNYSSARRSRRAVDLIPQSNYPHRPTKSIFQWGIPSELLPPMPVPVEAIRGLQVGNGGHYTMNIDLPEIPPMDPVRPAFSVEQLTIADFLKIDEIWSLSAISKWIFEMVVQFDAEIRISDIVVALTKLFMYRVPALEWAAAEKIADSVVESLKSQNFIDLAAAPLLVLHASSCVVSGVVTLLSGHEGCYSNGLPFVPANTCCYSSRCLREPRYALQTRIATISGSKRRVSLRAPSIRRAPSLRVSSGSGRPIPVVSSRSVSQSSHASLVPRPENAAAAEQSVSTEPTVPPLDDELFDPFATLEMNWRKYWHLEEADLSSIDPQLIKMQFAYHEMVMSEIAYVRDMRIYLDVYADIELLQDINIMKNQEQFSERVFDRIRAILSTNERLLAHIMEEHTAQGPYIHTLGRWIIDWAQNPTTLAAYQRYSDDYLWADAHLRKELARNPRVQKWMEERAKDPRLTGRPHSFFFHRVLPRLARYHLLLSAILKYTPESAQFERKQIQESIDACNRLTQACDDRVAKQKEVLDVQNVKAHIVFKSSAVTADLKLGDKRRKLIRRGNLIRKGDMKMEWVETHALLLDNYFVMSKTREGMNGTALYVTKPPIPLDLLVLESVDEDGVTKVSSRLTLVRHNASAESMQQSTTGMTSTATANNSGGGSSSGNTAGSDNRGAVMLGDGSSKLGGGIGGGSGGEHTLEYDKNQPLYPIRISHLGAGKSSYVLFAPNRPERTHWVKAIVEAKQARAQLAFARSAEPLKLVKISDQFAYPESETPHLPVPIPDTALHRAVGQTEGIERVILRRKINCMLTIGALHMAGTDFGIWMGRMKGIDEGAGGRTLGQKETIVWSRVSSVPQRVLKMEGLDSMNLLFVLCGDHNLIWYPLDQMIARGLGDKRKSMGVRLNQHRKVVDFSIAYHRGRVVLMYLQQGGVLKVIEPIRSHGATAMSNLAQLGLISTASCVDSFREIDRMAVPSDTTKITAFLKSIVLSTSKSFEWATLDTKSLFKIPAGRNSKEMQYWGHPIRIIKLDSNQILLCYESCYLIGDAAGNIGIHPTTWFLERAVDCAYYAPYLIVFSQGGEFIEVRFVDEFPGRLVQVITGKDIKLLSSSDDAIFIRMAHPWFSGRQLVLELTGNEIVKDTESTWYSSSSG